MLEPERLYESPFTDSAPQGLNMIFPSTDIDVIVTILATVRAKATVA
jgi:type I restriction enzyme R subunit